MFIHCLNMEIQRNVQRWGNSAGVLLPREWLGKQVQVVLIDRTLEIKKEVIDMLGDLLLDIIGIYLVGSYARGEQDKNSDIDVVAISNNTKKNIKSGKYDISIVTLDSVRKTLNKNPILILPRLLEAKTIFNNSLLEGLKNMKINKNSFNEYLKETESIIKIDEGFINLDKEQKLEYLDSVEIIYSMMLRSRGIFLIRNILNKKKYTKKSFLKFLKSNLDENEVNLTYNIYEKIRDNIKVKEKIRVDSAEKLLNLLKREIESLK